MPLTVAGMEQEILYRIGGKWAQAQLSVVVDGTNPYLNTAIRKGLRYFAIVPANPLAVVDADLATVLPSQTERYVDSCILEALYIVQGQFLQGFDQQIEEEKQSLHQIMTDLAAMIADYQSRVPKVNLPKFGVGTICKGRHIPEVPGMRRGLHWYGMGEF